MGKIIALATLLVVWVIWSIWSIGAQSAPVDLSQSLCLQPPMEVRQLTGRPPLDFPAGVGVTWDARDQTFVQDEMTQPGVLIPEKGSNTCILGATLIGPIGDDVPWRSSIKPDGIQHARPTGPYQVHGVWMTRVNDCLSPPKPSDISREVKFSYRDVYARCRDDALENDAALGGEVIDSLFYTHMGISSRPGGDGWTLPNVLRPTVRLENVMMMLICQTDTRSDARKSSCPSGTSHAKFFKYGKANFKDGEGVRYILKDVILRADHRPIQGPKGLNLPDDAQIDNVTVIYLGPDPDKLPSYPSGVRVITDRAEGERVWNDAEAKWLADHRCDQNGENCGYLTSAPVSPPPLPEPPEITAMYNSVEGLARSTDVMMAELPGGNLKRVGRNTGLLHSQNLHDTIHALATRLGERPVFSRMHTLASHSLERALALEAAVEAGDRIGAFLVALPELTGAIAMQLQAVHDAVSELAAEEDG